MHKIMQELNITGCTTRLIIIPRKSKQTTTDKEIKLQLALPLNDVANKSSKKV